MKKNNKDSSRKYAQILGIKLNSTREDEVLALVESFIAQGRKFTIFTPNPEIVLLAQKDEKLKKALNSADLLIPDGIGLKYAAKFLHKIDLNIIPGRKLFLKLLALARKNNWKVFFLGGKGIKNVTAGPMLNKSGEPVSERDRKIEIEIEKKINKVKPDLLFVGFGAPKQERWIFEHLSKLNIGGAMSVGGTFAYLAGRSRLPPEWLEKAGLEWLWRLIHEPKRFSRILRAVIIFPLRVFWYKFH